MSNQVLPKYSIVDLFAGAGGLSYGFLQTGRFAIKAAFENNPDAQKTYQRNHGAQVSMYNDVEDALSVETKAKLGQVDVVIGGPPCQGFSNANRQKNHAVCQNSFLVKKFVHTILHLNPTAFVMENVDMLKSDAHRFYVEESDKATIEQYGIATFPSEIHLIDEKFIFDGAVNIVENKEKTARYLLNEDEYFILNVIYKCRNNNKKLKSALIKHKKRLLTLAKKLSACADEKDHIIQQNNIASDAIYRYYSSNNTDEYHELLCNSIETIVMLQRMLSKSMEIHDNEIVVTGYSQDRKLLAKVNSMIILDYIESILSHEKNEYKITKGVLSAAAFGAPQKRMRFVIIGIKNNKARNLSMPSEKINEKYFRTVKDAIEDLENIETSIEVYDGNKGINLPEMPKYISDLGRKLRNSPVLYNHVSTATTAEALERFKAIKQGDNFHSLPPELKSSYSDAQRTQNTIYLRLKYDEPSGTVVNVRKSMWIHPVKDRSISIREAARLQTFPDSFVFCGVKNSQYQQVGNAVPPILAKAVAEHLCSYLDEGQRCG